MPNTALLAAVEQLQESYTAQHRALKSLLGAFKNTNSVLGKATRALRDYVAQVPAGPPESIDQAQQAFADLRLRDEVLDPVSADLRRESKLVAALETALKDAANALRGESVDVVRLGHAVAALQARAPETADTRLQELVPPLQAELHEAERTLGETFGEALRNAARAQDLVLEGRPPRFSIGRFAIDANFPGRAASISYGKEQVVKRVPLSVDAILKAYQREARAITGRTEDGRRWIELFYQAWVNVRRRREIKGERVNLVDCYLELIFLRQGRAFRVAPSRSTLAEYSRPQFAHDFVEFVERQRLDYNGWRAHAYASTKSQTDSAERSIWIVEGATPFEGRYISDVAFSKET